MWLNGMRVPCTWDTGAFRPVVAERFMCIVEEGEKVKKAIVKKVEVEEILCEGILRPVRVRNPQRLLRQL